MKNTILILSIAAMLTGCAAFKNAPTVDEIKQTITRVEVICNSAKMLSDAGLNIPGVEQCEKVVDQLTRDDVEVLLDVVKCLCDHEPQSMQLGRCAADRKIGPVLDAMRALAGGLSTKEVADSASI